MYDYNCPDCNEAKLQSDKNARKINEVIDQVNQIIDNDIATIEYLLEKADEIVGNVAEEKVNEELSDLITEIDTIKTSLDNKVNKVSPSEFNDDIQACLNYASEYNCNVEFPSNKTYYITETIYLCRNFSIPHKRIVINYFVKIKKARF